MGNSQTTDGKHAKSGKSPGKAKSFLKLGSRKAAKPRRDEHFTGVVPEDEPAELVDQTESNETATAERSANSGHHQASVTKHTAENKPATQQQQQQKVTPPSGESSSDSFFTDPLTPIGFAAEINQCYYSEESVDIDAELPNIQPDPTLWSADEVTNTFKLNEYRLRRESELGKKFSKLGRSKLSQISLDEREDDSFASDDVIVLSDMPYNIVPDGDLECNAESGVDNMDSLDAAAPDKSSAAFRPRKIELVSTRIAPDLNLVPGQGVYKRHLSMSDACPDTEGNVLKKGASLVLDKTSQEGKVCTKVIKPKFVPEKLDFKMYDKFEGHMLLNWYVSEISDRHYVRLLLNSSDLRLLATQFCTHLLAAGVLKQIPDSSVPLEQVFRPDLMYYWSHSEIPASVPQTPGKLNPNFWSSVSSTPSDIFVSPLSNNDFFKAPNTDKPSKTNGDYVRSPSASQLRIKALEQEIEQLNLTLEKYKAMMAIESLTENITRDYDSIEDEEVNAKDISTRRPSNVSIDKSKLILAQKTENIVPETKSPTQNSAKTSPINGTASKENHESSSCSSPTKGVKVSSDRCENRTKNNETSSEKKSPVKSVQQSQVKTPENKPAQSPSPEKQKSPAKQSPTSMYTFQQPMPDLIPAAPPMDDPSPQPTQQSSPAQDESPPANSANPPPPPPPPPPEDATGLQPSFTVPLPPQMPVVGPPPPPPPPMSGMGPPPPPMPGMGPPPPPMPGMGPPPPPMPGMPGIPPPPPPPLMLDGGPPPPPIPGMGIPPPPPTPKSAGLHSPGPVSLPPPPVGGWNNQKAALRKKPVIPPVPMKPLYWTRIVVPTQKAPEISVPSTSNMEPLWLQLEEQNIENLTEFADLFSRQVITRKPTKKKVEEQPKVKAVKVLDSKRSQNVGILAQSLHVEFGEIENAIYNFDTSVVSLEALQQIYEARATAEELEQIKTHVTNDPNVHLDKPEQFLYDLSEISNFANRISCFMFQTEFEDCISTIDSILSNLKDTCEFIMHNENLKVVFSIILTLGNFMNGGNMTRGQADGFGLEILSKLRDVKSKDNQVTLLHFIIRTYMKKLEDPTSPTLNLPIPEPGDVDRAASVNFDDTLKDLDNIQKKLDACDTRTKKVIEEATAENLEPFQTKMTTFVANSKKQLALQRENLEECKTKFISAIVFYHIKPKSGTIENFPPNEFFALWSSFCTDFKDIWKKEQQRILKEKLKEIKKKQENAKSNEPRMKKRENGLKSRIEKIWIAKNV